MFHDFIYVKLFTVNRFMDYEKYGSWKVPGKTFYKKTDALIYATEHGLPVKFSYHDSVWQNFDRTLLGKISLSTLYKERAQQIRDKYDYIILYYSGGADSHNVLRTYVDNDIQLDEVCIKWPKALIDGNFYKANSADQSARNYWSEWDYAIKPSLEWLSKFHPDIKITFKDYTESIDKLDVGNLFDNLNFVRGGGMLLNSVVSDSETTLLNKSIGHIYGIDKPLLHINEFDDVYMFFTDVCIDQVGYNPFNPNGAECFYWSPDFPLLPFEQAYQLSKNYTSMGHRDYFWSEKRLDNNERISLQRFQTEIGRTVLYHNWDNRFQADKPESAARKDKFFWFYENSELESLRNKYYGNLKDRVEVISDRWLTQKTDNNIPVYKVLSSPLFFVTNLKNLK